MLAAHKDPCWRNSHTLIPPYAGYVRVMLTPLPRCAWPTMLSLPATLAFWPTVGRTAGNPASARANSTSSPATFRSCTLTAAWIAGSVGCAASSAIIQMLGALPADAACEWTQRAGAPYIACDPGPASLSPPNKPARQPGHVPEVPLPPLAETPPQPPVAGTPAPPSAPAPPLGPSVGPEPLSRSPLRPSPPPPTLNPGSPGLLSPPGHAPALPGAR